MEAANEKSSVTTPETSTGERGPKPMAVYSIRETKRGSIWTRVGSAFLNKDGSLNVLLDALPVDGRLHVRAAPSQARTDPSTLAA